MSLLTDDDVTEFLKRRNDISKNKDWGMDLTEKLFIMGMVFLNPQAYGARIEKWVRLYLNFTKVPAKDNHGDLVNLITNLFYEMKVSLLTPSNSALNLVQIRLWQPNDYYICIAYDLRNMANYRK